MYHDQMESVSTRRRRVCSVVAPKLGVEHTENGARTIVVDNRQAPEDSPDETEQRLNSCGKINKQKCCHSTVENHGRVPPARPDQAVCPSGRIGQYEIADETDIRRYRKTQRSMSAHSVALPAPDSSILRDSLSGKIFKRGKLLGKGGFAKVYEGQEVGTGKRHALKIVDKSRLTYQLQRDKMETEIEMHAAASEAGHPNVTKFETMFENPRMLCLVLELCERRSLAQHLRRKGFLSESEVSDLIWQIVCGLAHIHGCGLLHRDLKLGNILLSGDDTVKIADFGLATRASLGKRKTVCGTPNFIAPEVLQRHGHGTESDVWSVGCILYTMLVGKPPFETTSLKDTYKCILKNLYTIPSCISPEAADLVRWMLAPKPRARPSLTDVLDHVFFVKHQTHTRFQSIDDLTKEFPHKKIASLYPLPQRRRSTVPGQTFNVKESHSCYTMGFTQICNNSCPSDAAMVRNDPSCSIGPKISIFDHMKRVQAIEERISLKSAETLVEDKSKETVQVSLKTDATTKACSKQQDIPEIKRDAIDSSWSKQKKEIVRTQSIREEIKSITKSKFDIAARKSSIKYSPVKMLASKLQKFKIPSPKRCMKAKLISTKGKTKDQGNTGDLTTPNRVSQTWITKWVDYSNKYGFGYQLANGKICVLFNNGAHIALMRDGKSVEYIEPNNTALGKRSVFGIQDPPAVHEYAVKILQFFITYMDKNLRRGSSASPEQENSQVDSVRMLTWSRTTERVAMYLSNGTLQVNFCDDHTKINVSNIHENSSMKVTFVDKNKETTTYERSQLGNARDSELRRRLEEAHEELHHLLEKEHCISHPFCAALDDTAVPGKVVERIDATIVIA